MADDIEVLSKTLLSDNWGELTKYTIALRHRDGSVSEQVREVYDRGHAAVILLCNPAANTVILCRQFRLPVHLSGDNGWLIEACAGLLDGDDPEMCAREEAEEETGYRPHTVRHAYDAYMSPGSVTEKLSFFIGECDARGKVSVGGGLASEGEDIEVVEIAFPEAIAMVARGEIIDAKTIMVLQYAAMSGALRL